MAGLRVYWRTLPVALCCMSVKQHGRLVLMNCSDSGSPPRSACTAVSEQSESWSLALHLSTDACAGSSRACWPCRRQAAGLRTLLTPTAPSAALLRALPSCCSRQQTAAPAAVAAAFAQGPCTLQPAVGPVAARQQQRFASPRVEDREMLTCDADQLRWAGKHACLTGAAAIFMADCNFVGLTG